MSRIKKTIIAIITSATLFLGVACTPEELAIWDSMNPVQRQELIHGAYNKQEYRELGKAIAIYEHGYSEADFTCLDNVVKRESAWRNVPNASGGRAYGIPQALPGSKMASHGADWKTNPATQIRWMLDYVEDRYSTPCRAWSFKQANGWY